MSREQQIEIIQRSRDRLAFRRRKNFIELTNDLAAEDRFALTDGAIYANDIQTVRVFLTFLREDPASEGGVNGSRV